MFGVGLASGPQVGQQLGTPMVAAFGFGLGAIVFAKFAIGSSTEIERRSQAQKSWMPLAEAVMAQPVINAVVAEVIEKACLDARCFGVGVDVSQGVEGTAAIGNGKSGAVVALFPKMAGTPQQPVKAHGGVPIQPVHDFW